ncbi:MAG TPA: M15 family metallopeptidase [Candidatus Acidoferrum sp.]
MRAELQSSLRRIFVLPLLFFVLFAGSASEQSSIPILPGPKPPDAPREWKNWIGDYGGSAQAFLCSVFERGGELLLSCEGKGEARLEADGREGYSVASPIIPRTANPPLRRDFHGVVILQIGDASWPRRSYIGQSDQVFRIRPVRPIGELRKSALLATPPKEGGNFRKPDLVELGPLDAGIRLDIRYATSNDFLGTPVYAQARAFLQRPAAEALLRVQQNLKPLGYGLLIHDAYRPWYVTKIFWDATPPEGKIFVADPAQGSRHNRGCAVDLTLYELASGRPVEMPGTYDEMSPRSYPKYPGGTSLERWHRDLLRRAMESEGFTVYEAEWWHFDYQDWKEYPILNVPFENLGLHPDVAAH